MTDGTTPLRIGVLTDGDDIPAWLAAALVEVQARGIGRVELVVERAGAEGAPIENVDDSGAVRSLPGERLA